MINNVLFYSVSRSADDCVKCMNVDLMQLKFQFI